MKKGRKAIVLCLLMAAVFVMPISAVKNEVKNVVFATEITVDDECGYCQTNPVFDVFINRPGRVEITEPVVLDDVSPRPTIMDTPDYFNWRDHEGQDWTTPVKDIAFPQWCASCWVFSTVSVIESSINIREGIADLDVDLSEQYVLSCLYGGSCAGGSEPSALKAIMDNSSRGNNCNGIIPESCMPYQADDRVPCEEKSEDWEDYLVPLLDYEVVLCDENSTEDREMIKSLIMQYGPVISGFTYTLNFSHWHNTHHDPNDYFPYEQTNAMIDHSIDIVGWKDDESIENGGYWIVKNNFGTDSGYDGFFNIEYRSLNIGDEYTVWVDYDPESYDWHPVPKINVLSQDSNYGIYSLINEPLEFTGDAQGEHPPFTYHWDFGDDTISEEQNPSHTYITSGEYTVTLTVTDDKGGSFYDIKSVYIKETNQPPNTPIIEGPSQVKAGEYGYYNITISDPDEDIVSLYFEMFGLESGTWLGPVDSGRTYRARSLEKLEKGEYTVKAKVKDPYGAESDWAEITVRVTKTYENPLYTLMEKLFDWLEQMFGREILPEIFNL